MSDLIEDVEELRSYAEQNSAYLYEKWELEKSSNRIKDALRLVANGERVYYCAMMKRLVTDDEMALGHEDGGVCYWDGDECEGGWRLLIQASIR